MILKLFILFTVVVLSYGYRYYQERSPVIHYHSKCLFEQCKCSRHYHYINCKDLNGTQFDLTKQDTSFHYLHGYGYTTIDFRSSGQLCLPPFWKLQMILPDLITILVDDNELCCPQMVHYKYLNVISPAKTCSETVDKP